MAAEYEFEFPGPNPEPEPVPTDHWERLAELGVFLLLILPSLVLSLFAAETEAGVSFDFIAWATILRDLGLVALVVFLVWRDGEPLRRVGWTLQNAWREALLGVVLFVPFFIIISVVQRLFMTMGLSIPRVPVPSFLVPQTPWQFVLATVLVVVVAIAEETVFRGYLLLRLPEVTVTRRVAVLISAIIFAIGHGYEGTAGIATVGVMGILFAILYLKRGSLVAPMVVHFLQDFIGIVLVPVAGGR